MVLFCGISTIVSNLMPNNVYRYILNIYIYDLSTHFIDNILKQTRAFFSHTVKWFHVFLYNSHNLTSIICLCTVCCIQPIDRNQSGAITLGESRTRSNDNEGVLDIPRITKAGASPSDILI